MCPHQCRIERKDHLPWPAGNIPPNAVKDTITVLCYQGLIAGSCSTWCSPEPPGPFQHIQWVGPQHILVYPSLALLCWNSFHQPTCPAMQPKRDALLTWPTLMRCAKEHCWRKLKLPSQCTASTLGDRALLVLVAHKMMQDKIFYPCWTGYCVGVPVESWILGVRMPWVFLQCQVQTETRRTCVHLSYQVLKPFPV